MQVDVYFSVGGSQPEDQFHTDDQGDVNYKYDAMFANRPIHGLIVDGYTAIEVIGAQVLSNTLVLLWMFSFFFFR